ncbi:MAG: hypothetical protein FJ207_13060 [Gemmatimonadetes bacterium]|nr:hypothetical protein [Gemmatimonadota bacterium]
MVELFWLAFWGVLSALVVAAGLKARARRRAALAAALPEIDDDAVRSIVETGALSVDADEPLDLSEIGEEEERFWSETWDEPEEV